MMMMPIIVLLIAGSLILSVVGSVGSSISNVSSGGQIRYNEQTMQNYADKQYAVEFGKAEEYEDNILLVFLVDEGYDGYYTIAWVGDNIKSDINDMFGNEYTEYGREMKENIPSYFENSLGRNLASVVDGMTDNIVNLGLKSSFIKNTTSPGNYKSHLTNNSSLAINNETVNRALEEFTEETNIPIVIVVDDIDNVFEKTINGGDIFTILIAVIISGFAIYFIVRAIKDKNDNKNKTSNNDPDDDERNNSTSW